MGIPGANVSETFWKLRCRVFPPKNVTTTAAGRRGGGAGAESATPSSSHEQSAAAGSPSAGAAKTTAGAAIEAQAAAAQTSSGAAPSIDDVINPTFGCDVAIKNLYEGPRASPACGSYDWVDYPPRQISKAAARAQERVAIKTYLVKDRTKAPVGGRYPLTWHQIEVQNQRLVTALEPILRDQGVFLDALETAEFDAPFASLYFSADRIAGLAAASAADSAVKPHLDLFADLLHDVFAETRLRVSQLRRAGLISFRLLWTLFPRGTAVFTSGLGGHELAARVESTETRLGKVFVISAKMIIFNGEEFVWRDVELPIPLFEGNRPIGELPSFPLEFHADAAAVRERLRARARLALDCQSLGYCTYSGVALHDAGASNVTRHNVEGRVLIDPAGYSRFHRQGGKASRRGPSASRNSVIKKTAAGPVIDVLGDVMNMAIKAKAGKDGGGPEQEATRTRRLTPEEQASNTEEILALGDEMMYMSPLVKGYALKNKMWLKFFVEDIRPMVWNATAYDHLVYDEQQKDLVLSFVENHSRAGAGDADPIRDVIIGKGRGLIMLLSGPPGTGKTLTAEAVADRARRPLFYLQAEDLGISAASLGANLKRVLDMAADWDAVVLLDEADVFMAERCPGDVVRNELVSIFLRELEYFSGVLFLTTNLPAGIDQAFRSRVSLHLLFRSLERGARAKVWERFLEMATEGRHLAVGGKDDEEVEGGSNGVQDENVLSAADIDQLALWRLNGREIKNAVKMVKSWCDFKGYAVSLDRIESGIRVTSPHAVKDGDGPGRLYE